MIRLVLERWASTLATARRGSPAEPPRRFRAARPAMRSAWCAQGVGIDPALRQAQPPHYDSAAWVGGGRRRLGRLVVLVVVEVGGVVGGVGGVVVVGSRRRSRTRCGSGRQNCRLRSPGRADPCLPCSRRRTCRRSRWGPPLTITTSTPMLDVQSKNLAVGGVADVDGDGQRAVGERAVSHGLDLQRVMPAGHEGFPGTVWA